MAQLHVELRSEITNLYFEIVKHVESSLFLTIIRFNEAEMTTSLHFKLTLQLLTCIASSYNNLRLSKMYPIANTD